MTDYNTCKQRKSDRKGFPEGEKVEKYGTSPNVPY